LGKPSRKLEERENVANLVGGACIFGNTERKEGSSTKRR
jgi:hypothetical protein